MSIANEMTTAKLRLKQMKLSGFKSFVEPTSLYFPSHLVGIVGPNGCGKSNIIDAVRWVLGESSAKSLRAESGTDVIFNGSSDRKPVGQAQVELIFDNPPGAVIGEYANFRELSVKRLIERDGQSTYYLNQVRCRRKDITDLFLGTGLGPRSYAVIEQGMISRIIEAKPEDLRVYLEEAAGISRYHERRRETEISIKHTRENITRLSDLSQELAKQLETLAEQAKTAKIYRELQQTHKTVQHDLLTKQWQIAKQKQTQLSEARKAIDTEIELKAQSLTSLEEQLAALQETAEQRYQAVHELQTAFYQLGADVGRIEEQLSGLQTAIAKAEQEIVAVEKNTGEVSQKAEIDHLRQIELSEFLAEKAKESEFLAKEHLELQETLSTLEQNYQQTEATWQELSQTVNAANTEVQLSQAKQQQEEKQLQHLEKRIEKLQLEQAQLTPIASSELNKLRTDFEVLQAELKQLETKKQNTEHELQQVLPTIKNQEQEKQNAQKHLLQHEAKLASLKTLQEAALGQDDKQQQSWLTLRGLADQRLGQLLSVAAPWQKAVEALLGDWLQAVVIDKSWGDLLAQGMPPSGSVFMRPNDKVLDWPQSLASVVNKPALLPPAFQQVYVADDLRSALELLNQQDEVNSVLLPDGLWISRDWVRVPAAIATETSVLSRADLIKELEQTIKTASAQFALLEESLINLYEMRQQLEDAQSEERQAHQQMVTAVAKAEAALTIKQAEYAQFETQQQQYLDALSECQSEHIVATQKLNDLRTEELQAREKLVQLMTSQQSLAKNRESEQLLRQQQRQAEREKQQALHTLTIAIERAQAELATLKERQLNYEKLKASQQEKLTHLTLQLSQDNETQTTIQSYLQAALHKRLSAEAEVTHAKTEHESLQAQMSELTQMRQQSQRELDKLRENSAKIASETEAETVREQHWQEQAMACQYESDPANLPEPVGSLSQLSKRLNELQVEMTALEPVNLGAIDAYQEAESRHVFLEAQQADLLSALATLEEAIAKIDKETRTRLSETFTQVNLAFQDLFPKVFAGGSAYLSLTEDELLTAGITVMARPPGKRNTSIHLLSGGEKALTAIAFIFSIFQLNPAPFCLLDEVDAPLDEANVNRYCDLIREMSKDVQFIFISHNRITMELAEQLLGVTMKEPGVSRLVAVDLAETMDFIAANA